MKKSRHLLLIADSVDAAWTGAILPWCERTLPDCWKNSLPSLVVVPTRGQANYLREKLLRAGRSHLGLQIVTPTALRALLGENRAAASASPEHLRLLLALAATEIERDSHESDALAAKAVARAPALLLRTLDRLQTAGWKFEESPLPSFARLVRRFRELLRACDFILPGELDRLRMKQSASTTRCFSNLLLAGFDGAHWPQWFLLRRAVGLAEQATVLVEQPRGELSELDLCWIGSWEEAIGEAEFFESPASARGDAFFTEDEMRGTATGSARLDFLVGTNASEQAAAITRQCVRYLSDSKCTRLGVIFTGGGALPRLVASALSQLEIPHNDAIGHIVPGLFESAAWQAWIDLQRAPRLHSLLRFLNARRDPNAFVFEKILRESYGEVLLDDLEILREFCAAQVSEKYQSVAQALRDFLFLPPRATLSEFLAQSHTTLQRFGWEQHSIELAQRSEAWAHRLAPQISRALYLRWLEETAATFGAARAPAGDHPYARVQLLTVPHALQQEWSHLIFAGWNEGAWPPPAGAEFARDAEIRAFNRSIQQLNRRAARQGIQGEGHASVRADHSLYLGPIEQRAIALRQFETLLEAASVGATLSASLVQEDAPERFWNPSECFTQLYLKTFGEPLTQATLKKLQCATALLPNESSGSPEIRQTLVAFEARRDPSTPAGEYDFALRPNESYRPVPRLSVSDLQRLVSGPALIWMKRYLGVEAAEETGNPWAAASGKWVHRWLAGIAQAQEGKRFAPFPSPAQIDERIRHFSDERRATLQQLCDSLGKAVPDWRNSGWLNARYLARHLGGKIAGAKEWNWMAAEVEIGGRDGAVKIVGEVELQLRGFIDLVLAQSDAADFSGQKIWIVDYKTGSTKELRTTDLHDSLVKGDTIQLALYSLAIRELGAAEVDASIISLAVKNVAPQLSAADLLPHTNVFADLAEMQRTGVFGGKGELRPAFGFSQAYPLASLPIDQDILEDKWALTHPNLVLEKEEWEMF